MPKRTAFVMGPVERQIYMLHRREGLSAAAAKFRIKLRRLKMGVK